MQGDDIKSAEVASSDNIKTADATNAGSEKAAPEDAATALNSALAAAEKDLAELQAFDKRSDTTMKQPSSSSPRGGRWMLLGHADPQLLWTLLALGVMGGGFFFCLCVLAVGIARSAVVADEEEEEVEEFRVEANQVVGRWRQSTNKSFTSSIRTRTAERSTSASSDGGGPAGSSSSEGGRAGPPDHREAPAVPGLLLVGRNKETQYGTMAE